MRRNVGHVESGNDVESGSIPPCPIDCSGVSNFRFMNLLRFTPIYQERVWGGRELARVFGRSLPGEGPIGESWELSDRAEAQSVVAEGMMAGKTLNELWTNNRQEVFGPGLANHPAPRFPLLVKILDARDDLSVQVHPPEHQAVRLGGEAKSEMWHVVAAGPGARLYAGLRPGIGRAEFETAIRDGSVADCLAVHPVAAGDALFLPSGRVHAIGAGVLIFEIQQNSDTTYRVFDWNRKGLDGKPREIHIDESLEAIDFTDHHVALWRGEGGGDSVLADCPHFRVVRRDAAAGGVAELEDGDAVVIGVISGSLTTGGSVLRPGDFALAAAGASRVMVAGPDGARWLEAVVPPMS